MTVIWVFSRKSTIEEFSFSPAHMLMLVLYDQEKNQIERVKLKREEARTYSRCLNLHFLERYIVCKSLLAITLDFWVSIIQMMDTVFILWIIKVCYNFPGFIPLSTKYGAYYLRFSVGIAQVYQRGIRKTIP